MAQAFVGILRESGIEFDPERIEAELVQEEGSRPDLTIHDGDGHVRILVENKFWAGLTDAQPVSYLKDVPEDPPSALMFIVPEQRVSAVWQELERRCRNAHLHWTDTSGTGSARFARVGSKTMSIADWDRVLERLLDAARSGGHDKVAHDILQLQALTDRMNSEAFLPLRDEELTTHEAARRSINYVDLYGDILKELERIGYVYKEGFGAASGPYHTGRYFSFSKSRKFESWFGFDLKEWRDAGITPLWWWFSNKFGIKPDHFKTNPELFSDVRFHPHAQNVPIRLTTGVERDRVINDAVAQMKRIADHVLEQIPND